MIVKSPRDFALAMRELVERSQQFSATAVSDQAYEMKLRILSYFAERGPDQDAFERALQERISDPDPQKELSKGVCCQIFNTWRSGSYYYTSEGKLVVRALYPADQPRVLSDDSE